MRQNINRFIYGSEGINKLAEYDAYEGYENSESGAVEGGYCNNDCFNCMLDCPYKGY
jgi:hypothetical protein